jgi:hypothetical protein
MTETLQWLLRSSPWTRYRTMLDLMHKPAQNIDVCQARHDMLNHPQIQAIIQELLTWPGYALKRHNDANHLLHKLVFLADIGLTINDKPIAAIVDRILSNQSDEGPFQIVAHLSSHYGGTDRDELVWFLCDAPLIVYALSCFGLKDEPRVKKALEFLIGTARDHGWPCKVSQNLGKFRGPGRAGDACPYSTLIMLRALTRFNEYQKQPLVQTGLDAMLGLWDKRKERKPYLFAMGTDFTKLKLPFVWYDILHVLEVLTQFPQLKKDARVLAMVEMVKSKPDQDGRFTPESIYLSWKAWDFGQKKVPSPWMTLMALRMLQRIE